eukprot:TRINITY_DN661_c0_g1_i1.p1 TRINITY_DN661_c0_g1~~TRINITY_DN661_c0_g1_i1.p1  ORF type:complete len:350 (-),score=58.99 TRINITY_DN661_c0_g1_i1:97-1146(-)
MFLLLDISSYLSMLLYPLIAVVVLTLLTRLYFTYFRQIPLWLPDEKTFTDPISNSKRTFSTVFEEASIDLTCVVPAYNETKRITKMFDETIDYLHKRYDSNPSFTWELIVVNDGSKDNTVQVVYEYERQRLKLSKDKSSIYKGGEIRVLDLIKNRGKGGAVRRGMMYGRGKYLLMVDADGATKFSDLDKVEISLKNLERKSGTDKACLAAGSRAHILEQEAAERVWYRNVLSMVFHLLVAVLCVRGIKDTQCGFKLFNRKAAQILFPNQHIERWAFDVELLLMARNQGMNIVEVPVDWEEIEGSTLNPIAASIQMARDLLRIRLMYILGVWSVRKDTVGYYKDALSKTF